MSVTNRRKVGEGIWAVSYDHPTRTKYRVQWREGGRRDGQQRTRTFSLLAEAKAFRGELVANGYREPTGKIATRPRATRTLADLVEPYLASLVDADRRTVADYRRLVTAHVLPTLGSRALDDIDASVIQGWIDHMRNKVYRRGGVSRRYAPKTILNIVTGVLAPMFAFACEASRRWMAHNPMADRQVRLPRQRGRTVRDEHIVHGHEMGIWIKAAYAVDHRLNASGEQTDCGPFTACNSVQHETGDAVVVFLSTGLRWGELTALRVCDVDLDRGTIRVSQVVKEDEHGGLYVDKARGKSENALRTIMLPEIALAVLGRRAGCRASDDLLFPAPGGRGAYWRGSHFHTHRWRHVRQVARAAGAKKDPSPHRLRHSHAALTIPAVGIEIVSKRLGHANVGITSSLYSHLTPDSDGQAAVAIDKAIGAAFP